MKNNKSPLDLVEQIKRAFAVCKKDIRIYYFKPPVLIFGILLPLFLYLAFLIGRNISASFLVPGLLGMTIFFTATSVVPLIAPWETRMKTLERLVSAPISITAIVLGDVLASFLFGIVFSIVPLVVGLFMGISILHPATLVVGILIAALCFSSLAAILSTPPTNNPSSVMMMATLVKFPLVFISGIFIPIEEMPAWGKVIASASPLTYFTDLARYSLQSFNHYPIIIDIAIIAVFTTVFLITAIKLHKRNIPKRL